MAGPRQRHGHQVGAGMIIVLLAGILWLMLPRANDDYGPGDSIIEYRPTRGQFGTTAREPRVIG